MLSSKSSEEEAEKAKMSLERLGPSSRIRLSSLAEPPPWPWWSLETGEPRDCLCMVTKSHNKIEKKEMSELAVPVSCVTW